MLDLNREYSPVYGSSLAAFYQVQNGVGRYFDADHKEVPPEVAAQPNPEVEARKAEEARAKAAAAEPAAPPATPAAPAAPAADDRREKLRALHGVRVAQLVIEAGGTPETGNGSKAKNIDWLLANTD